MLRIAIISDTHFGDPMGTLVVPDSNGKPIIGPKYEAFKDAVKEPKGKGEENDYLILLGDILDFSICSYKEAYEIAKVFFLQIQKDKIAKEIIYVVGNHDFDLWHTVEYEVNVIAQIKKGKPPRPFRMSVPGFIDDRKGSDSYGFTLPGVSEKTNPNEPKYAGLFLDHITDVGEYLFSVDIKYQQDFDSDISKDIPADLRNEFRNKKKIVLSSNATIEIQEKGSMWKVNDKGNNKQYFIIKDKNAKGEDTLNIHEEGKPTYFNFAYPNIYMVTDKNETILITHGHYLETYWASAGEWSMKIAQEDLQVGGALDLKEMVAINFPLSQLACSGVGQAGPLTNVVRKVQRDAKDGNLERISKYLDRLDNEVDNLTQFPWYKRYLEWLTDAVSNALKDMVLEAIKNMKETKYNEEFIRKKEVQTRFENFYNASVVEIHKLNRKYGYSIPIPFYYVIFGHTHQPTQWGDENAPPIKFPLTLFNAGGWLNRINEKKQVEFCGAEVFTYRTGEGFKSTLVT